MGGADLYTEVAIETTLVSEFLYFIFMFLAAIAVYVFESLSLYTVAQRRGLRKAWLAWLPIGNMWLLGSVSDQYQYLVKGRINNRRKLLLCLSLAMVAMYALCGYFFYRALELGYAETGETVLLALLMLVTLFGVFAFAITVTVFEYICYFDLFRSCDPVNGVLFLVLSILFPGTLPFVLFAIRKRDGGMPPRKQPIPQPVCVPMPVEDVPVQPEPAETAETQESDGGENDEQTIPVADA